MQATRYPGDLHSNEGRYMTVYQRLWQWKKKRQTIEHTNTVCLSQAGHTHKPSCDELHSCLHEVHTVLEDDLKRKNIHVQYLGGVLNSLQYSRFSLSRSPNDSPKYFEIYEHLHIRFLQNWGKSQSNDHILQRIYILTPKVWGVLKIFWKEEKLLQRSNYFVTC